METPHLGKELEWIRRKKKKESNIVVEKIAKKLKEDFGFDCNYCNGANHLAVDCMLRKRQEKKERDKYEAYYVERLEEVRAETKGLSLVVKGGVEGDGTYQIWSSGSNDQEMRNPTHGAMYARFREGGLEEENITRKCFVSIGANRSPMTLTVHTLLESLNIPSSSYHIVLSEFDETLSYVNHMLISIDRYSKTLGV